MIAVSSFKQIPLMKFGSVMSAMFLGSTARSVSKKILPASPRYHSQRFAPVSRFFGIRTPNRLHWTKLVDRPPPSSRTRRCTFWRLSYLHDNAAFGKPDSGSLGSAIIAAERPNGRVNLLLECWKIRSQHVGVSHFQKQTHQ